MTLTEQLLQALDEVLTFPITCTSGLDDETFNPKYERLLDLHRQHKAQHGDKTPISNGSAKSYNPDEVLPPAYEPKGCAPGDA